MNKTLGYLFHLLRCVINDTMPEKPDDGADLDLLFKIAKHHNIANMICYGLEKLNEPLDKSVMEPFVYEKNFAIYKAAYLENDLTAVCDALEKNRIKHMPLKGSVVKYLYPSIDMRTSVDIDILFEKEYKEKIKEIMRSLGYTFEEEGYNHDIYRRKNVVIEMHTSLISEKHSIYKHFENTWDSVLLCENKEYMYQMTGEDFYIYTIAHLTKHFMNSGIGIRSFLDVYICKKKLKLDGDFIKNRLEEIGIYQFSQNVEALCEIWFENKESSGLLDEMAAFVIRSGEQGTKSIAMLNFISRVEGKNTKLNYYFKRLFLPMVDMKRHHKVLKKHPYLIIFFWVSRFLKIIFKKGKLKDSVNNFESSDLNTAKKVQEMHKKLGLNR